MNLYKKINIIFLVATIFVSSEVHAIDINKSGTRKEDKLIGKTDLPRIWLIRNMLSDMTNVEAMKFFKDKLSRTKSNREFLDTLNQ